MLQNFKQFVPSNVCLSCDGCCRFKQSDSRWRPHMTKEEQRIALQYNISEKFSIGSVFLLMKELEQYLVRAGFCADF